jgi:hypothetical protein
MKCKIKGFRSATNEKLETLKQRQTQKPFTNAKQRKKERRLEKDNMNVIPLNLRVIMIKFDGTHFKLARLIWEFELVARGPNCARKQLTPFINGAL